MPKTTINENNRFILPQDNIRLPRETNLIYPETQTLSV